MFKDFKEFAMQGNVVDLAVGVVLGGAFGKIVSSLVEDLIMPIMGLLFGGIDFSSLAIPVGSATINYGLFINAIVDFLLISFSIFFVIRQLGKFSKEKEDKEEKVTTQECPYCITKISIDATRCPNCTSALEKSIS